MPEIHEPPIHLDDTSPAGMIQHTDSVRGKGVAWVNWLISGAALIITLAAGAIYLQQNNQPTNESSVAGPQVVANATTDTVDSATQVPTLAPQNQTSGQAQAITENAIPLDVVAELLTQPGDNAPPSDKIFRQQTAFTIAPVRARATSIDYIIQQGDNLDKIAAHFGISKDTIVWNNDIAYVNRLQPGDDLTILPEDGIMEKTLSNTTIQAIADKDQASPYSIIDSEYNHLQNAKPSTLVPANMTVFVPGGVGTKKEYYWDPGISYKAASSKPAVPIQGGSGVSSNASGEVSFGGGPGSCGYQPNNGGGALRVPLAPGYTVVRGFFPGHTGIDLAAPVGTPVFAAASGTVIFAGWSNWGYGNSIVLAHGNLMTLYGHLSRINVTCGQVVNGGQPIGAVGSTGNSTGPHLHFEIRPGGTPVNPTQYLAF